MVTQAFADESGNGMDTPVFVLSAYVSKLDRWERFSDRWQEALDGPPSLPTFHMTDFQSRKRGFEMLKDKDEEAEDRLQMLAGLAIQYAMRSMTVFLPTDLYLKHVHGKLGGRKRFDHPYVVAAPALVMGILQLEDRKGIDFGKIDFMFGHHQTSGFIQRSINNDLRPLLENEFPSLAARLGEFYRPTEVARYRPLQAADMLAWHQHRERVAKEGRRIFKALVTGVRGETSTIDEERILGFMRAIGRLPPDDELAQKPVSTPDPEG